MPRLSVKPFIHRECKLSNNILGAYTELGKGTRLQNAVFGYYSYTDRYADVANAVIGKFANIAVFSRIGPGGHPMELASMHHFIYRSDDYWDGTERWEQFFESRASKVITMGHDTWIGSHAQIMPQVTIGTGAVIAAGAVVTKDVAPYTVVAGVPAVPINKRFSDVISDRMQALAWWDWGHAALKASLLDLRTLSAEAFLAKYES